MLSRNISTYNSDNTFTISDDGIFVLEYQNNSAGFFDYGDIIINGISQKNLGTVKISDVLNNARVYYRIPVKKGDNVKIYYSFPTSWSRSIAMWMMLLTKEN